ncbi:MULTISPECIES: hypothetical protein [Salmonella]|uniref:Uncharacterized protein n=1 Tax=Salmonella enterica TaxID=28901 RepID=A0A757BAQ5_SALER|nr:hypothetical protein [Salmonella enterica]EEA3697105.1 hypothetical protein [Salmonella enterica subsp. enterica serovar Bareilly]EEI5166259.1 hypothetical protein [Salmonella enterica subsp. enterica serovar Cerro]EFS0356786.1 hypothetical protein [Salmonella enterica subsp. enterica serovar Weltevreden]EHE7853556.1 hypothetical protein [Salmonella enterica subsp. enterica serovar Teko]EHJ6244050.1 hypothetical protein [Salmonella enterica subsp. enterica serovar 4,[5],12:b:-]EHJ7195482.1
MKTISEEGTPGGERRHGAAAARDLAHFWIFMGTPPCVITSCFYLFNFNFTCPFVLSKGHLTSM